MFERTAAVCRALASGPGLWTLHRLPLECRIAVRVARRLVCDHSALVSGDHVGALYRVCRSLGIGPLVAGGQWRATFLRCSVPLPC